MPTKSKSGTHRSKAKRNSAANRPPDEHGRIESADADLSYCPPPKRNAYSPTDDPAEGGRNDWPEVEHDDSNDRRDL